MPTPDLNQFISVIKFSPVSIWTQFNKKPENKAYMCPDVLRNNVQFLENIMENQQFQDTNMINQMHNYGLAICLNACKIFFYFEINREI